MISDKSISLCMVVFNSSDLAERAIKSVRGIIDEVVIVDQGSDEEHANRLKELADIYVCTTNKGNADYDRDFCYSLARKQYILAMDADEEFEGEQIKKFIPILIDYDIEAAWFLFKNVIQHEGVEFDIRDLLGDDPHPRFWKKMVQINGQAAPGISWPHEAHRFPAINTAKQAFLDVKFTHRRELANVVRTHLRRGKNIDGEAQRMEVKFVRDVLDKFGSKVESEMKLKFPELKDYLKAKS